MFLTDKIKLDEIPTKIKWKIQTCFRDWQLLSSLADFVHYVNPHLPLFMMENIKLTGIPHEIKWEIDVSVTLYIFQVINVLLIKSYKISRYQFFCPLLLYISRYHFLQLFKTSFNIIWKKIFATNFASLTNSPKPPPP